MCIEFLGLDGDKELVTLPNSLLFSCFKQQRIFNENSRKSCCFVLFLFSWFTYIFLAKSWRKVVIFSSADYLLSYLVFYSAKLWQVFQETVWHTREENSFMLWFTCECVPVWLLFMVISEYTECWCFCHSVPFPGCSCVYRTGRWHEHLFCVRNASWEVTPFGDWFTIYSRPVPFLCGCPHLSLL